MKIPQDLQEKISEANAEWLWNQFILLKDEFKEFPKIYDKVRYGINIRDFEIFDLWRPESRAIIVKPKMRKVSINGKLYKLSDYWTEEQDRIALMRQTLFENLNEPSPIVPR